MERLDDNELTSRESSSGIAGTSTSTETGDRTTPEPSVNELKAEISQTQGNLQQTLSEIQERLSPANIAEQAKNTVRDATVGKVTDMAERAGDTASRMAERAGDTASRMVEQTRRAAEGLPRPVRENPLPLALIGVGLAWLLIRTRSSNGRSDWDRDRNWSRDNRNDDWYDEYGGTPGRSSYGRAQEYSEYSEYSAFSDRTGQTGSSSESNVSERVGEMASDVSRRARSLSRTTQNRLEQTMRENPMALGIVALAAGALIGTMMPRTEMEDSYMGEARDNIVDSARQMAEEKVQTLSDAVRDSGETGSNNAPNTSSSSPS